jgi:hypothetical protein
MDLTPYLPFAPVLGVIFAAAAFTFNVRNARLQRKKAGEERERAAEEQPSRVFLGVVHSPPEAPTESTYFIHNGSDSPVYRVVLHWRESGPRPNKVTTIPMIPPGGRTFLKGQEYLPPSHSSAEFDDRGGKRWHITEDGRLERISPTSSLNRENYDRLVKQMEQE